MKIFTDESGDFSLHNKTTPSLVASLICTEDMYGGITRFMHAFESRTNGGNEIKGSQLSLEHRKKVCNFIQKNRANLKISITVVSPEQVTPDNLEDFRSLQSDIFERNKQWYISQGGHSEEIQSHYDKLIKIARYNTRMSNAEFLQSVLLVQQLSRVLTYCMVYFCESKFRRDFKEFKFLFDRKQPKKLSGMEKYFQSYVMPFLDAQSKLGYRIQLDESWNEGHPFIDNYTLEHEGKIAISLNKIFGDNCHFMDSKIEPGLRLIDIISNTVYNYIVNPGVPEYVECYYLLKDAMGSDKPLNHIMLREKKVYKYKEPDSFFLKK